MTEKDFVTKIEDALIKTHLSLTEPSETDTEWNMRVMAKVRTHGQHLFMQPGSWWYTAVAQRIVWRFGTLAGLVALVLSIYTFGTTFIPEQVTMNLFINEPFVALTTGLFAL